jgi:hypothetical protein
VPSRRCGSLSAAPTRLIYHTKKIISEEQLISLLLPASNVLHTLGMQIIDEMGTILISKFTCHPCRETDRAG